MSSVGRKACYAMIFVALFAIITFGLMSSTNDDSSAASEGTVYSGETPVGTYVLTGNTITITSSSSSSGAASITMPDLTPEERVPISNVVIKGFTQNLSSSFSTFPQYPNITIIYKGDILPDGAPLPHDAHQGDVIRLGAPGRERDLGGIAVQRLRDPLPGDPHPRGRLSTHLVDAARVAVTLGVRQ